MSQWKIGDRVWLMLPDKSLRWSREMRVTGTVTAVDPPGLPPGVAVALDRQINGVQDCYATHRELRVIDCVEVSG